ncbi:hypothetical protein LCGC14_0963830 [marine sediment metagenome]|uniref:Uncharacterized protein n=1 Tax=marine sediment metagenome TaxID=412755 RepID=A0A0F9QWU4_9ZZZZ
METLPKLLAEMKPLLVVAGVKKGQIDLSIAKPFIKTAVAAFDWLHDLYMSPEYENMVKACALVPPETWERYKLLEIEGLAEQIILENASKELLKKWRTKRPRLLGKRKKTNEQKSNS